MEAPPAPFTPTDLLVVAFSPCLPQTLPSLMRNSAVPLSRVSLHHRDWTLHICPERQLEGTGVGQCWPWDCTRLMKKLQISCRIRDMLAGEW